MEKIMNDIIKINYIKFIKNNNLELLCKKLSYILCSNNQKHNVNKLFTNKLLKFTKICDAQYVFPVYIGESTFYGGNKIG